MEYQKKINSINTQLFYLLPITLIFSNFLSNLIIFFITIYGLYSIIKNKEYKLFSNIYIMIFISFCIFISFNSLLSAQPEFKSLKSSFFLIRYLFFVIGIYYLHKFNNKIIKNFFYVYVILLIFLFIDSNYQLFNNGINLTGFHSYGEQHDRISSFFYSELILGSYVQKFSILLACYFYFINENKEKFIPIILLISIQICYISGERLAFYNLLIFCILYFLFFINISVFIRLFLVLVISGIFTLVSFNHPTKGRIFGETYENIAHSNFKYFSPGHKKHLDIALHMFSDKPLFGHGSNKFRINCNYYQEKYKIGGCSTHPHNIVAQFLSENGIVGILFLLTFYTFLIVNILKNINFNQNRKKKASFLILISIALFFNPIFPSANFYNSWVNNIIFIIFSYLIILNSKKIIFNKFSS